MRTLLSPSSSKGQPSSCSLEWSPIQSYVSSLPSLETRRTDSKPDLPPLVPSSLQLLTQLVLQFIFPETADIAALRQCLGYFLPVYCFSSPVNQRRMKDVSRLLLLAPTKFESDLFFLFALQIFLPTLQQLLSQEDEDGITPSQFSLLFLDWTDPQRAV